MLSLNLNRVTYCLLGQQCSNSICVRHRFNCWALTGCTFKLQSFSKHGRNLFSKNFTDQCSDQFIVHRPASINKQLDSRLTKCIHWSITHTILAISESSFILDMWNHSALWSVIFLYYSNILAYLLTHTKHTTILRLCGLCPGQPGWADTRSYILPSSGFSGAKWR